MTIAHVEEHGWSVVGVLADEECPGWSYTVGLWHSHRAPELAMFGLGTQNAQACLNTLGTRAAIGHALAAGQEHHDVIERYPLALRPVDERWFQPFFGAVIGHYRVPPIPCLQVVWPDRHGRFPWEKECDQRCREAQPLLWLPPDDHPPGLWTQEL